HPALFKWAGMAAFGSHRVGLALSPYRFRFVSRDLEQLRLTNNAIYADLAWAHLAFAERGLSALESTMHASEHRLVEGFRCIDAGRRTSDEWLVWHGNELLLEHEQAVTVQAAFDRLGRGFEVLLSLTTSLDFDADNARFDPQTNSFFYAYMLTKGLPVL